MTIGIALVLLAVGLRTPFCCVISIYGRYNKKGQSFHTDNHHLNPGVNISGYGTRPPEFNADLHVPLTCPSCRQARKSERGGGGSYGGSSSYGSTRQMFPVKCATCGKDTEVPFEPRGDRPVYCSDCYRKVAPPRSDDRGGGFSGGRGRRY